MSGMRHALTPVVQDTLQSTVVVSLGHKSPREIFVGFPPTTNPLKVLSPGRVSRSEMMREAQFPKELFDETIIKREP